jgi:hypothetical protein
MLAAGALVRFASQTLEEFLWTILGTKRAR